MVRKRHAWIGIDRVYVSNTHMARSPVWNSRGRETVTREKVVLDLWLLADLLKEEGFVKENCPFSVLAPMA